MAQSVEELATGSEVCDISAEIRSQTPRRDRDMRAELQAWKEAKAARAAQQKAQKAAELPAFQVPRRLRAPAPPPSIRTTSGSENVPYGDTASAAVKLAKVAVPAPQQGCPAAVSPRVSSPMKAIRPLGERSQNTLGADSVRSVSPSLRFTQSRTSPRSRSRPTTPTPKASESAPLTQPASAGNLARAALCASQQAVSPPSAAQAGEAREASQASEPAVAALPESCTEAASSCGAMSDRAAAEELEEPTCISMPSSSSSASSSPRSAAESSAPEAELMEESVSPRMGLSLAAPEGLEEHPPAPCVPLCWQPPAPPGPPPDMPLFDQQPEPEAASGSCAGVCTPERRQRRQHADDEKAFAATAAECIALYEERGALPISPPPSPATPSAAFAAAKSMLCQMVDADAEFAQAATAAVARLAHIEEPSSPAPAWSPSLQERPKTQDVMGESRPEPPHASSPTASLSPLSLESPETAKMLQTP
mmetsp:Transcript_4610/g.8297  ORF Transcript_4610/g.8297 Transcript_4610/m.8297 type:complete len:479 (+) Transcript_4610:51-1487(+)